MTKRQRIVSLTLTAVLAALFAVAPLFYPQNLAPTEAADVLRRTPAPWQGVLTVWQVNTWRVGRGSRAALANLAVTRYEKAQIGVWAEVIGLTPEEFTKRWAAGERPDVVSFPDGWTGLTGVELLDLTASSTGLQEPYATAFAAEPRALPWMAGGTVVLIGNDVGRAVGVEPPVADASWTAQALVDYAASASAPRRKKRPTALTGAAGCWDALALAGVRVSGLAGGVKAQSIDQARQQWAGGSTAVLLGTQWEGALLERLAAKNKAPDYTLLPLPNDVPAVLNVQYVAALSSGDEERDEVAAALARAFLSLTVQKAVANSACLPVVALPEEAQPKGELETLLRAQAANAWMPAALTARDDALVAAALDGDGQAVAALRGRYRRAQTPWMASGQAP